MFNLKLGRLIFINKQITNNRLFINKTLKYFFSTMNKNPYRI
jgi:hypothetical protein